MSFAGALEIARETRAGRLSATASVQQALTRIDAAEPRLNAFTAILRDRALCEARALDARIAAGAEVGPLAGVPFTAKNLFDIAGLPTLAGSRIRADAAPATRDACLVRGLTRAGAILVGAQNMDEFAYGFVTENAHYGATHNPHDLTRIAGGSSGASAAAVAAGLVPLSLGSDTNGSIRIPAGLCGVFGLKPTRGELSLEGVFPFVENLDHAGVFARDLDDLEATYAVLRGGSTARAAYPPVTRTAKLGGWFLQGATDEVVEALETACRALATTETVNAATAETARSAAFGLTAYEGGRLHLDDLRARAQDFDPAVRDRLLAGALLPERIAKDAEAYRLVVAREFADLFERYDVLLAPITPCVAPKIGDGVMAMDGVDVSVRKNLGAYTQPLSFIGLPVLAAPIYRPGQLPIGIQIIAAAGREDRLFATAAKLIAAGVVAFSPPEGF